jgi:hypothetical protein
LSYPKSFSPESSWGGDAYLDRKRLKTFFAVRDKSQFMEAFEEMKVGGKVDKNICNLALKFAVHIEDKGLAETLFAYMESEGVPVDKESCQSFVKASLYSEEPEDVLTALETVSKYDPGEYRRVPFGQNLYAAVLKHLLRGHRSENIPARNVRVAKKVYGMLEMEVAENKRRWMEARDRGFQAGNVIQNKEPPIGIHLGGIVMKYHALRGNWEEVENQWKHQMKNFEYLDQKMKRIPGSRRNFVPESVRSEKRWAMVRDYIYAVDVAFQCVDDADAEARKKETDYAKEIYDAVAFGLAGGVTPRAPVSQAVLQYIKTSEIFGKYESIASGIMMYEIAKRALETTDCVPTTLLLNKYLAMVHQFASFEKTERGTKSTHEELKSRGLYFIEPMKIPDTCKGARQLEDNFLYDLESFLNEKTKRIFYDINNDEKRKQGGGQNGKSPWYSSINTTTYNYCLKILPNQMYVASRDSNGFLWETRWENYIEEYSNYAFDIKKKMERGKRTQPNTTTYNNLLDLFGSSPFGMKTCSDLFVEMLRRKVPCNEHTYMKMLRALRVRMKYFRWELRKGFSPNIQKDEFKLYFMMLSQKIKEGELGETGGLPDFLEKARNDLKKLDDKKVVGKELAAHGVDSAPVADPSADDQA